MYCPKCSTEAYDPEQKFCKSCGTNLQLVAETLRQGHASLETYRIDFEGVKRSLKDMGTSLQIALAGDEPAPSKRLSKKEVELRQELLACSRTRNLQKGVANIFSGVGLGAFLYYITQAGLASGAIRSLEARTGVSGLEAIIEIVWLVALIPTMTGLGFVINGLFFGRTAEKLLKAEVEADASQPALPPTSVTEHTTAHLPAAPLSRHTK